MAGSGARFAEPPDAQARIQEFGFLAEGTTAERAEAFLRAEGEKWAGVIRARKLRVEEQRRTA
ncbi:hypothetical protein [Rubritepida flocculans]|uniref:hypothetical protein n=1 Tax=Rubritepida flocculans TaxID=182403 RepID=UPI0004057516|nr:hypothetical protein [Rubritepida flocculans]